MRSKADIGESTLRLVEGSGAYLPRASLKWE